MCEFFSCVITRDGRIFFTEKDSHEIIVIRAGLNDDRDVDRNFQRIEVRESTDFGTVLSSARFVIDEYNPALWVDSDMRDRTLALYERIKPLHDVYQAKVDEIGKWAYDKQRAIYARFDTRSRECQALHEAEADKMRHEIENNPEVLALRDAANDAFMIANRQIAPERDWQPFRDASDALEAKKEELKEKLGYLAIIKAWAAENKRAGKARHASLKRLTIKQAKDTQAALDAYIATISGIEGYLPLVVAES